MITLMFVFYTEIILLSIIRIIKKNIVELKWIY